MKPHSGMGHPNRNEKPFTVEACDQQNAEIYLADFLAH